MELAKALKVMALGSSESDFTEEQLEAMTVVLQAFTELKDVVAVLAERDKAVKDALLAQDSVLGQLIQEKRAKNAFVEAALRDGHDL